ncbi:hypothetical protein CHUAL_001075 [Chamberlinius hualienensis]
MALKAVDRWSFDEVAKWLDEKGFRNYIDLFCDIHKIDGLALLMLTESDLRNQPLSLTVLGDIKRLSYCIQQLRVENLQCLQRLGMISEVASISSDLGVHLTTLLASGEASTSSLKNNKHGHSSSESLSSAHESPEKASSHVGFETFEGQPHRLLEPEIIKTVISVGYFFAVTWVTAIVMVIVHDRVPDMGKYPPLPDIFLDNMPHIPWAFQMCEVTGCILGTIWLVILVFHKHRFILLRRMFALFGTVFLLRCVTMLITSLSVPGRHLDCRARPYGDRWATLGQAFEIWRGAGMAIQGVRSCGDYMFSGHTVTLTMTNFFITEYTPRRFYYLHTFTWVLNAFGVFFILSAHEHYSIDVFIAFYISTRLFLYYHTLANNRDLMHRDNKRTRIWFPLFYFFESNIGGNCTK